MFMKTVNYKFTFYYGIDNTNLAQDNVIILFKNGLVRKIDLYAINPLYTFLL